ncbi:hypothetical protein Pla108_10070 [Botrimarina colliarenosi]|uniref:DUF3500 domain-containing protein n=1 Tax=Botrimarina colliarenosi TaxID=2528001 RepID=A0A5C6AJ39_9BACT|nr:DUF3500 domain-containing protein [Botrimarina colliarenosi]TWU00063.1 hypothetical protein Pla108_10070 [Botrimarina colliarenosi]
MSSARPLTAALLLLASAAGAREPSGAAVLEATEEMRAAAAAWLTTLDDDLRTQGTFAFDGPERTNWQFVPMERVGVAFKEMNLPQRRAARALMRSALSDRGYLKVTTIMSLENVLRTMEADRPDVASRRDQEKYWFAVFGDPTATDGRPWGWRVEGHHVSLNFASTGPETDDPLASTPLFLGANPAEVRVGPRVGLRALGAEDDLGRAVMASLDAEQRAAATLAPEAPGDVAGVPGAPPKIEGPAGLSVREMNATQQAAVRRLVESFANLLRPEAADDLLSEIDSAGFDQLHFAWAGSVATLTDPATTKRHYFRVHGPTFILELDFQEPNHVHSVWHSTTDDFGLETLRRHHAAHAH